MSTLRHSAFVSALLLASVPWAPLRAWDSAPSSSVLPAEQAADPLALLPDTTEIVIEMRAMDPLFAFLGRIHQGALLVQCDAVIQTNRMAEKLGLTGAEVRGKYMGRQVVLARLKASDEVKTRFESQDRLLIFSQVADADRDLAVAKLGLKRPTACGQFTLYENADETGVTAFGGGWMVLADRADRPALQAMLTGQEKPLVADMEFKRLRKMLPTTADGSSQALQIYVARGPSKQAMAGTMGERGLTIDCVGSGGETFDFSDGTGEAAAMSPLPLSAANTLGLLALQARTTMPAAWVRKMDRILSPLSFSKQIAPGLVAPTTFFLGESGVGDAQFPVLGLSVGVKDDATAAALDQAIEKGVSLLNLATTDWKVDPMVWRTETVNGHGYRVAEIGHLLAEHEGIEELETLRLTWGRIGTHMVLCTNEAYFKTLLSGGQAVSMPVKPKNMGQVHSYCQLDCGHLGRHITSWEPLLAKYGVFDDGKDGDAAGVGEECMGNHEIFSLLTGVISDLGTVEMMSGTHVSEVGIHVGRLELRLAPVKSDGVKPRF